MSEQKYQPDYIMWFEPEFWADRYVIQMHSVARHYYKSLLQAALFCSTRPYLPTNDEELRILADAEPAEWEKHRAAALHKFAKVVVDGVELYSHKRLMGEWQRILNVKAARSKGGKGKRPVNTSFADESSSSTQLELKSTNEHAHGDVHQHAHEDQVSEQSSSESKTTPCSDSEPKCGYCEEPLSQCKQYLKCKEAVPVQTKPAPKAQPAAAKQPVADPLRNWSEEVDGVPAERIRLCVRFMLDIKRDPWFTSNISVAALRRPGFLHKLVDECPPDSEIQKQVKATIKTEWKYAPNCPQKCNKGKIRFTPEGSKFAETRHCECFHEVEVAA